MKDCLIIGHPNAATYKDVFPLIKKGILRMGYTGNKTLPFTTPEKDKTLDMNVSFYTTLLTPDKPKLILTKRYDPALYPKYDNYDAINVDRLKDIPYDYEGVMGVPITILGKNLDNVEIIDYCGSHGKEPRNIPHENGMINGKWKYHRVLIQKEE